MNNKLNIENIITERARVEVINTPKSIKVLFNGEIDSKNPDSVFLPFFMNIHNQVIKNKFELVELDFGNLSFMNSGGIKTLIKWLTKAIISNSGKKYKFVILANSKIAWQESSLKMLAKLSPKLIEVKIL